MKKMIVVVLLVGIFICRLASAGEPPCSPKAQGLKVTSATAKTVTIPDGAAEKKRAVYLDRKPITPNGCDFGTYTANINSTTDEGNVILIEGKRDIFENGPSLNWQCVIDGHNATGYYNEPNNIAWNYDKYAIPCGTKGDIQGIQCTDYGTKKAVGVYDEWVRSTGNQIRVISIGGTCNKRAHREGGQELYTVANNKATCYWTDSTGQAIMKIGIIKTDYVGGCEESGSSGSSSPSPSSGGGGLKGLFKKR